MKKARIQPRSAVTTTIERFFLYGLEEREHDDHFLHYEAIEDRSDLHNWNVRPHLHHRLNQVFLLRRGRGEILIEDTWQQCAAPALIVMPADTVHGFRLSDDTSAPVVTIADSFFREIAAVVEPEIAGSLDRARLLPIPPADLPAIDAAFTIIKSEHRWGALGHTTALTAQVAMLFTFAARLSRRLDSSEELGVSEELLTRFRTLIEDRFLEHWSVADYAKTLAVTTARLNTVCRRSLGLSALEVIHARLLTEARRLLRYSMMSAAETAYTLGFKDPAYFSRFFARAVGVTPGTFRARGPAPRRARRRPQAPRQRDLRRRG